MIRVITEKDNVVYINDSMFEHFFFDKKKRYVEVCSKDKILMNVFGAVEVDYITDKVICSDIYNIKSKE